MRCTRGCARRWLDPKRLLIINELRDGPMAVGDIAGALQISQPNVSRHLAVLRD
jgi:DNA-binding transcriptional ArsR family regulator